MREKADEKAMNPMGNLIGSTESTSETMVQQQSWYGHLYQYCRKYPEVAFSYALTISK